MRISPQKEFKRPETVLLCVCIVCLHMWKHEYVSALVVVYAHSYGFTSVPNLNNVTCIVPSPSKVK